MQIRDNRMLALIALAIFAAIWIFNPNWLAYLLEMIESLIIIVLGSVATIYLLKRL